MFESVGVGECVSWDRISGWTNELSALERLYIGSNGRAEILVENDVL
jgi:hypothetical protein